MKMTKTFLLSMLLACTGCTEEINTKEVYVKGDSGKFPDYGEVLAFPGAEGFGRYATGGRGGEIYHVTNLNDDGEGSFRDAVSKSDRIIVFDVAGIINLKSTLIFSKNLTIAGQTAPGDGIVLYGNRVSFTDADNLIIGQGLQNHSCGGLMQTDLENGITLFRNLYIDNKTRNPKVKGLNQFVNNVVYNWGSGAAYNMSGDSEGSSLTSIENNYFIKGPVVNWQNVRQEDGSIKVELVDMSPTKPFIGGNERFNTYCVGNFYDEDKNGVLNGVEILPAINWEELCSGNPTFLATCPEIFPTISQQLDAEKAYEWIVKYVGASLPVRDQVDTYLIGELTSLGEKGTIIQNEQDTQQFPLGGVGEIESGVSLLDTDGDGMPDEFEDGYGLDKNNPDDASQMAENGYTNIENYRFTLDERLDK